MTDGELLDRWHQSEPIHGSAGDDDLLEALIAEVAAIAGFGFGSHQAIYHARLSLDAEARQ